MNICVYGASSPTIDRSFIEAGEEMGAMLARRGHSLVYGGGSNGMMGAAARGAASEGGRVCGVVPQFFIDEACETINFNANEMILTTTMRERKSRMEFLSEAFIILPGGIGTFEEFFEILTLKQLKQHEKPIAVYNINGYYDKLPVLLDNAIEKHFVTPACRSLYGIFDDPSELFEYLETDKPGDYSLSELKEG